MNLTTLIGTESADTLHAANDGTYVKGLGGNDTVHGANRVAKLIVDTGSDNDTITFSVEILDTTLRVSDGNDSVNLADYSGSIYGGDGNDSVNITASRTTTNSLLRGGTGKDYFSLANLVNTLINGNSDDDMFTLAGTITNSQIYGGRQKDTINVLENSESSLIRGDAHEDKITINGDLVNTIVNGNAGDDQLIITSNAVSSSTVYGGVGMDDIDIQSDAIYVNAGKDGDDVDITSNKNHTIYGGAGNDTINSSSTEAITINGGKGQDSITLTGSGASKFFHAIDGGEGNDSISASSGTDIIDGGKQNSGDDTLISGGGDDTIYGRSGNDVVKLEAGINAGKVLIHAGAGDDTVEVKLSELTFRDIIKGEKGSDTIAVIGNAADFNMFEPNTTEEKAFDSISTFEILAFGTSSTSFTVSGTKTFSLSNKVQSAGIESIDASKASGLGDDVLVVNAFQFSSSTDLTFIGSEDKDVNVNFTGGSGNDTLTTGQITEDDSDTLAGGLGVDTFNIVATNSIALVTDLGKGGNDALIINSSAMGVTATVTNDYNATSATSNENSTLSKVILNANDGVNINMNEATGRFGYVINGGIAASQLQGSDFSDSITGNVRDDSLVGGFGNDTITGGAGADNINAGKGNGYITDAGNGNDIITHDRGSSLVIQNTGIDSVTLNATRGGVYLVTNAAVVGNRTVDASASTSDLGLDGSNAGSNQVIYTGGSGDDTIKGGLGNDILTGNDGDDTITGGIGTDTIYVGTGVDTVVFTSGLTIDTISEFTTSDIGAFDLSDLEADDAVENGETLDFVTGRGGGNPVLAGDTINLQTISGSTTLEASTNILSYTAQSVANAAALETVLETNGGIVTTFAALEENDAFVIQYKDSDTHTYSYAIAYLEDSGVGAAAKIANWEVADIATTNLTSAFSTSQFTFAA